MPWLWPMDQRPGLRLLLATIAFGVRSDSRTLQSSWWVLVQLDLQRSSAGGSLSGSDPGGLACSPNRRQAGGGQGMKKSRSIEEAILSKDRCVGGVVDGRGVVRLAQRFDMSAQSVREVLQKMGFRIESTFCGRHIWRKRD